MWACFRFLSLILPKNSKVLDLRLESYLEHQHLDQPAPPIYKVWEQKQREARNSCSLERLANYIITTAGHSVSILLLCFGMHFIYRSTRYYQQKLKPKYQYVLWQYRSVFSKLCLQYENTCPQSLWYAFVHVNKQCCTQVDCVCMQVSCVIFIACIEYKIRAK